MGKKEGYLEAMHGNEADGREGVVSGVRVGKISIQINLCKGNVASVSMEIIGLQNTYIRARMSLTKHWDPQTTYLWRHSWWQQCMHLEHQPPEYQQRRHQCHGECRTP